MEAKCKKCGYVTTFSSSKVKNVKSDVKQLDIFGEEHFVVYGTIKCQHCGAKISTESKEDLIKKEKLM